MESIREIYRIGVGPSSSHTMGPKRAAEEYRRRWPEASRFRVTLYGSLAATGRGHLTDVAIAAALAPASVEFVWREEILWPLHPNAMELDVIAATGEASDRQRVYSIGGGAIRGDDEPPPSAHPYPFSTMAEVLKWTAREGKTMWELVTQVEGEEILAYLALVWQTMKLTVARGLEAEGVLPGSLRLQRKASSYYARARSTAGFMQKIGLNFAYALAVAEENAAGGEVVTAPTCGSCGVMPAVLSLLEETYPNAEIKILRALATAGLVGNLVKTNASISGAAVGCQGEIGTACAMAAAAATALMGGTTRQVEYAAEMGLEHHLGLTCDPVDGLVQIPCIERNAMAAERALDAASYSLLSDGRHRVPFDAVVSAMAATGRDLQTEYRETGKGGLARCL
ncbi:MAG TPA: L-serine ammonia-lyase [Candidatus Aminicenantes bacterium]|nr:L-serine ammonia-lyase [Candidatus Aminicenantes bacterium]